MKLLIQGLLIACLCLGFAAHAGQADKNSGVIHVVLVWLKEPGNAEHRQQVIAGADKLRQIPGVQDLRVGEVVESERDVVDDSFDVALYMRFASIEDMKSYLAHPDHVNAVKTEFVPIMDHYRVYDFTDE